MIVWTDYVRFRVRLRGFDLARIERIVRYSTEKYTDRVTGRQIVVGRHRKTLVIIPIDSQGKNIVPVTVHRTTREQITARLKSGRYAHV